jgi:hypothetical protein
MGPCFRRDDLACGMHKPTDAPDGQISKSVDFLSSPFRKNISLRD